MRVALVMLRAAVALLDLAAQLCATAVSMLFGLAFVASLPFQAVAWILLSLSRRLMHGAPPAPALPIDDGSAP